MMSSLLLGHAASSYAPPIRRYGGQSAPGFPRPSLTTLEQARAARDGVVILAGGSWPYLVCPALRVRCDEPVLARLVAALDALLDADPAYAIVKYERLRPGSLDEVAPFGRVDGARYTGELWLDPRLAPFELEQEVRGILSGRVDGLRETTEELLERAKIAEPHAVRWPRRLAMIYQERIWSSSGEARIAVAAKALTELETLLRFGVRYELLLARVAFEAGAYARAAEVAGQMLRDAWRRISTSSNYNCCCYGRWVHDAHILLGRIAFRAGDTAGAVAHLHEAGRAPLVLRRPSERPRFSLAQEVLRAAERGAVLRYLSLCEFTWRENDGRLRRWAAVIDDGGVPEFEPDAPPEWIGCTFV